MPPIPPEKQKLVLGHAGKKDDLAVTVDVDSHHHPDVDGEEGIFQAE